MTNKKKNKSNKLKYFFHIETKKLKKKLINMDKLSYNKYPSKIHKKLETNICNSLNFKIFIIKVSLIPKIFNIKLIIILPF